MSVLVSFGFEGGNIGMTVNGATLLIYFVCLFFPHLSMVGGVCGLSGVPGIIESHRWFIRREIERER